MCLRACLLELGWLNIYVCWRKKGTKRKEGRKDGTLFLWGDLHPPNLGLGERGSALWRVYSGMCMQPAGWEQSPRAGTRASAVAVALTPACWQPALQPVGASVVSRCGRPARLGLPTASPHAHKTGPRLDVLRAGSASVRPVLEVPGTQQSFWVSHPARDRIISFQSTTRDSKRWPVNLCL